MKEQLQGLNLYFIGMMGVGKSTVGKLVARELGYQFFDSDLVVEQAAKMSIAQIFETQGEEAFRDLESAALSELSAYKQLVIATGGGIVLRRSNWGNLQQGLVIWLDIPIDPLYERLRRDTKRPLLLTENPKETLRALLDARRSLYSAADLHVVPEPDASPKQTAAKVIAAIPSALKTPDSSKPRPTP